MFKRITSNEYKLDNIINIIKEVDNSLDKLAKTIPDIKAIDKYYGSKEWFLDKEKYEQGIISNIKAGILSEDSAWNMFEDLKELSIKMQNIANKININKEVKNEN